MQFALEWNAKENSITNSLVAAVVVIFVVVVVSTAIMDIKMEQFLSKIVMSRPKNHIDVSLCFADIV